MISLFEAIPSKKKKKEKKEKKKTTAFWEQMDKEARISTESHQRLSVR